MTSLETTKLVAKVLSSQKAEDIKVLEVNNLTILADYFVIASTNNATHVKSLCDEVEFALRQQNIVPKNLEGYQFANWIILDYHDVVVHIFHEETRNFYALERLWADGKEVDVASE